MKNTIEEQADAIPIIRADSIAPPHNRDNLRKRLLQMIVRSEAERRPIQTPGSGAPKTRDRVVETDELISSAEKPSCWLRQKGCAACRSPL